MPCPAHALATLLPPHSGQTSDPEDHSNDPLSFGTASDASLTGFPQEATACSPSKGDGGGGGGGGECIDALFQYTDSNGEAWLATNDCTAGTADCSNAVEIGNTGFFKLRKIDNQVRLMCYRLCCCGCCACSSTTCIDLTTDVLLCAVILCPHTRPVC